jgi:hypothetical protein
MRLSFCQEFVTVLCSDHRYPDRGIILQTFEQLPDEDKKKVLAAVRVLGKQPPE